MRAQACLNSHKEDVEALEGWVARLREKDRYKQLDDEHGHPFRSWQHFCTTRQPFGLGYSPDAIEQIVRERRRAQELAASEDVAPLAPPKPQPGDPSRNPAGRGATKNKVDNINLDTGGRSCGGTSAAYIVRRLKRDAPEIAEKLAAGDFPSARSAGIAAGIVKVPTRVEKALREVRRMTPAELSDFEQRFGDYLEEKGKRDAR